MSFVPSVCLAVLCFALCFIVCLETQIEKEKQVFSLTSHITNSHFDGALAAILHIFLRLVVR